MSLVTANRDGRLRPRKLLTTILALPNYRLHATDKTVTTFRERPAGELEDLRAWFYPGREWVRNSYMQDRGPSSWRRKPFQPVLGLASSVLPTKLMRKTINSDQLSGA